MTNEKQPEDPYRAALLAVLAASITEGEVPPGLAGKPEMIAEILVERFKVLTSAEESVAGLMELGAEMAARGDRWKKLAGRAFDTLCKKPNEHWQKAAELAEKLLEELGTDLERVCQIDGLGNPTGAEPVDTEDFQDALDYARAAKETPEEVRLTYKNRYVKAASFTAGEQMAERIQIAFKDAVGRGQQLAAMASGIVIP